MASCAPDTQSISQVSTHEQVSAAVTRLEHGHTRQLRYANTFPGRGTGHRFAKCGRLPSALAIKVVPVDQLTPNRCSDVRSPSTTAHESNRGETHGQRCLACYRRWRPRGGTSIFTRNSPRLSARWSSLTPRYS